ESTKEGTKHSALATRLATLGYASLRFDFSYVGESEGAFEDLTISGEVDDLGGACDELRRRGAGDLALVGSSLGGTVALLYAATIATPIRRTLRRCSTAPSHGSRRISPSPISARRRCGAPRPAADARRVLRLRCRRRGARACRPARHLSVLPRRSAQLPSMPLLRRACVQRVSRAAGGARSRQGAGELLRLV